MVSEGQHASKIQHKHVIVNQDCHKKVFSADLAVLCAPCFASQSFDIDESGHISRDELWRALSAHRRSESLQADIQDILAKVGASRPSDEHAEAHCVQCGCLELRLP